MNTNKRILAAVSSLFSLLTVSSVHASILRKAEKPSIARSGEGTGTCVGQTRTAPVSPKELEALSKLIEADTNN